MKTQANISKYISTALFLVAFYTGTSQENSSEYQHYFLNSRERTGAFEAKPDIENRPNIFVITVDMISPDTYLPDRALSKYIKTPNLDKLAQSGTRFNKSFSTAPICGPARASILTGRFQPYLTNGERAPMGMVTDLKATEIVFPEYLKKVGYNIQHVGKWHIGAEKFVQAFGENEQGWNRWAPPLLDDGLYVEFLKTQGIKNQIYSKELRGLQADGKTKGNSFGGWVTQSDGNPFPLQAHYSVFLAELAKQKLEAARANHPNNPVFLEIEFFDPHQPYSIPAGFEARYLELQKQVRVPESYKKWAQSDFKDTPGAPDIYKLYRKYWGLYDEKVAKDYIIAHLLQMEVVDHAIGLFFDYLHKNNLWKNSVIIYTADHGEMNARLGLVDKGVYFQPEVFRTPLYIKPPQSVKSTTKNYDGAVSSLDLAPTILKFAGIKPPEYMEGEDLAPVTVGNKRADLHHIFQTGWHVGVNYGFGYQFLIEGKHWFYGYNISSGIQEMYDIDADDQINHFYDTNKEALRKTIVNRVAKVMQADNRWLGYWSTFRLHNAEYLPVAGDDMQMFKPKEKH